jgi:hypothetical protein
MNEDDKEIQGVEAPAENEAPVVTETVEVAPEGDVGA